jgi:hypothetical protein
MEPVSTSGYDFWRRDPSYGRHWVVRHARVGQVLGHAAKHPKMQVPNMVRRELPKKETSSSPDTVKMAALLPCCAALLLGLPSGHLDGRHSLLELNSAPLPSPSAEYHAPLPSPSAEYHVSPFEASSYVMNLLLHPVGVKPNHDLDDKSIRSSGGI